MRAYLVLRCPYLYLGFALALIAAPAAGQEWSRKQLACNMSVPGIPPTQADAPLYGCNGGNGLNGRFPWTVPPGRWLCVTDIHLVNKFVADPATQRTLYFILPNISVPAHSPARNFLTPFVYPPGFAVTAGFLSSMEQDQNVYGIVTGYISDNRDCRR